MFFFEQKVKFAHFKNSMDDEFYLLLIMYLDIFFFG